MIALALRELLVRKGATALAVIGLLTATLGFSALGLAARTTTATLTGDITRAWNTPYDLLIRPPGTQSDLERDAGLVRPNFMSGIHGGITRGQLAAVRGVDGVAVAAPLASVGFVYWPSAIQVPLTAAGSATMYRVRSTENADAGLSTYPLEERYIIVAPEGVLDGRASTLTLNGRSLSCRYPTSCFAGTTCFDTCTAGGYPSSANANYYLPLLQPIVIAGIDPVAEAQLTGLDGCLRSGSYLSGASGPISGGDTGEQYTKLPVLVSSSPFIDEQVRVEIAQAGDGAWMSGSTTTVSAWTPVASQDRVLADLYQDYLPSIHDYLDPWPIWSTGEVEYLSRGPREVQARVAPPSADVFDKIAVSEYGIPDALLIPPESGDVNFRPVIVHPDADRTPEGRPFENYRSKAWNVVGTYDPRCIPGFDPLAGGALEAYSYPTVRLPGGAQLGPTRSMSSYVNSPPLLLTTLDGAAWLADRDRYVDQPGDYFIGVIRVRVSGVEQPGKEAQARLARVAADINAQTGLLVDVVKGGSPDTVTVHLPAGSFGRPELTATEQWSLKGIALVFLQVIGAQDVAFSSLALTGAAVLVGVTTLAAVRRRRQEFAVLRAIGWSPWWIGGLIELETLLLGLFVGALSLALLAVLDQQLHLAFTQVQLLATLPTATLVALAAGLIPARAAAHGSTLPSLRGPRPLTMRGSPSRSVTMLAARDLFARSPVEALLAVGVLAFGVELLGTVLLVAVAFRGHLDTTVLGVHLAGQVQPHHVLVGAVTLIVAAFAAGQTVALGLLERRRELAALRAIGWPALWIVRLLVTQTALLVGLGAGVGATALALTASLLGAAAAVLLTAVVLGLVLTILATILAVLVPLRAAYQLSPAATLRGE